MLFGMKLEAKARLEELTMMVKARRLKLGDSKFMHTAVCYWETAVYPEPNDEDNYSFKKD